MLVSVFKRTYFMQFILFILVPVLLWMPAFLSAPQLVINPSLDMPFYTWLLPLFEGNEMIAVALAFVLVLGQAIMLNYVFSTNKMIGSTTYMPAFLYMLLLSSDYRLMTLSSILIANTFVILCLYVFLKCYNKTEGLDEIYLSTLFLAIGSLFYTPLILLMIWIWVGLLNFKIYKWRSFFVSIFGFLSPFIVLMVYYYLSDNNELIFSFLSDHYAILPTTNILTQPIQIVYVVFLMLILAVPAFIRSMSLRYNQILSVRKRISTLLIFLIFALLPFAYVLDIPSMTFIFAPVLAYILSLYMFNFKREVYADVRLLILVVLTIVKIFVNR